MRPQSTTFTLLFITACGVSAPAPRTQFETTLSGVATFEGPLVSRMVEVFDFAGGKKGDLFGGTTTDEAGRWFISLGTLFGDVLVEVATSEGRALERISAVVDALELGEVRAGVQVTPITSLVTSYTTFLMSEGFGLAESIERSRALLHEHFGGVDHAKIEPLDARSPHASEISDGVVAGVLLAGLSAEAHALRKRGGPAPGKAVGAEALVGAFSRDLEDGVFDGRARFGASLSFSGVPLEVESLRLHYAAAIQSFLEGSLNGSGLRSADFREILEKIRTNESELFPPGSAATRDEEAPRMVQVVLVDQEENELLNTVTAGERVGVPVRGIRGRVQIRVRAEDATGVRAIHMAGEWRNLVLGEDVAPRPEDGWFWFETTGIPDGVYVFDLALEDVLGNERHEEISVTVDNTPPRVTLVAPLRSATPRVSVSGTIVGESGPVDVKLIVGGRVEAIFKEATARFSAVIAVPCGEEVVVEAVAIDGAKNVSTPASVVVVCDATGPQIVLQRTSFIQERDLVVEKDATGALIYTVPSSVREIELSENTNFPVRLEKYFTRFDDLVPLGGVSASGTNLPVLFFLAFDESGAVRNVDYRYLVGGQVARDWTPISVGSLGEGTIPVSYQALSPELVRHDVSVLHRIEIRAVDDVANESTRTFDFTVDALSPPLWLSGCEPTQDLTWAGLPAAYTTSLEVPIVRGELEYRLDLPEGSLAPSEGVDVVLSAPLAESRILEVGEQKFSGAWGGNSQSGNCGAFGAEDHYRIMEDWSGSVRCSGGYYPEEHAFWDVASRGPVNDPSPHATEVSLSDSFGTEIPMVGGAHRLPSNVVGTVMAELLSPKLIRHGAIYDWTTAYAAVPAGHTPTVNVVGKYRLTDLSHTGKDTRGVFQPYYRRWVREPRPFVTRASITRFEVKTEPVGIRAVHPILPHAVIEVRRTPTCDQPVVQELSE